MHDVSPELALVDDALAARERGRLPEPDDCLASRPVAPVAAAPSAPTLTLLVPPEAQQAVEIEPEAPPLPPTESEPYVAGSRQPGTLALAESPADPAALVRPEPLVEAAAPAEPGPIDADLEIAEPEVTPEMPPVDDAEPHADEPESAPPEEPAPAVPTRMPEWVASDVPPKGRRERRRDRALARAERTARPRALRRRIAVVVSWIVLCAFLASPLLAFFPSPNGERPTLAEAPDGVESVPDPGDEAGRTLSWEPVPEAAGYSVVFVSDGVRSDRWSQTAELRLPAGTESEQLVTYEWSVYPAFQDGAGYRYGPLVASGEVTMPILAPTEGS
jgi:hypothetical protein